MNKQVNFEDNVFMLMMRMRIIRDSITLDADPELFLKKILDDISFTDHSLGVLLGSLEENSRLNEREALLESLIEAERQFSRVLSAFLEHEGIFSVRELEPVKDKLTAFRNKSLERRKIAGDLSRAGKNTPNEPIVSSDELTELLKAF